MEEHIFFDSKNIQLEGMINSSLTDKGVVITHPHPQYGGDMYNHVVTLITHVLKNKGYTTLRFNFRGVGKSQGKYDNGNGEQQDVVSAINYLAGIGIKQIDLAGYSFGAWINALVAGNNPVIKRTLMVSPPVAFVDFSPVASIKSLKLVVTGSNDDVAPVELINKSVQVWNPAAKIKIIDGADHFYSTHMPELENTLDGF